MKGVILAAGYGTRFLPWTRTMPKEMIPLVDRPSIDFIVSEFVASGVDEILVVSSRRKKALEDWFDREIELETVLARPADERKRRLLEPPRARVFFARQPEMRGTGDAILLARPFIGDEPFIVAYPDDIHVGEVPLARQLIQAWERTGCSVLATLHDPPELNRYGVISIAPDGLHVTDIVEKPPKGGEPSREASIGRFLYAPGFLDELASQRGRHGSGEFFHTPAVQALARRGKVVYHRVEGERLDTGDPAGYLEALIGYAESRPDLAPALAAALARRGFAKSGRPTA